MSGWVVRGLRTGVKSTRYPAACEDAAGVSPGRPVAGDAGSEAAAAALAARCPVQAISARGAALDIDHSRCVHCFGCVRDGDGARAEWGPGFEWATLGTPAREHLAGVFGRSLHIRFLDAGACGACMSEARQLTNPYYNIHRLGFFITPTPRNADVLLVAGPVTDAMRGALRKTWEAMPAPKRVVAMGVCALSGGVFGPGFASGAGVEDVIAVDVTIPGCPPPPLAILHGLLVAVERKPPATFMSSAACT